METVFWLPAFYSLVYTGIAVLLIAGLLRLKPGRNRKLHRFSIIVAARNEKDRIGECLKTLLNQDYDPARYEIIVVNDRSTDHTDEAVKAWRTAEPRLTLLSVEECPPGVSPKKNAMRMGIEQAVNEILVFTDADCRVPASWLSIINRTFEPQVGLAAGLTAYRRPENMPALLFGVQALDFFSHAVTSAGAMGLHFPINTNANNLAVRRQVYDAVKGFRSFQRVVSGDDDLLLQAVWKKTGHQVRYMPEPGAGVSTEPTPTLKALWEQRKRWGSKTIYYNPGQTALLSAIFLFYVIIAAGIAAGLFFSPLLTPALTALAVKTGADFTIACTGMARFKKWALLPYFPVWAAVHIPCVLAACIGGVFGRFTWKGETSKRALTT